MTFETTKHSFQFFTKTVKLILKTEFKSNQTRFGDKATNLSVRSRSLRRNLSLSSSTTLRMLSKSCFLSCAPRFVTSISFLTTRPLLITCWSIPFLTRSYVGSRSIAAHFSSSSSSAASWRRVLFLWNTSGAPCQTSRMLPDRQLPGPLAAWTRSSPPKAAAIFV